MRSRTLLLAVVLLGVTCALVCLGATPLVKGDYEAAVTENGLEAKFRGIPFICGSHVNIHKPEWKGMAYSSRSRTAKVEAAADRVVITDSVPEIEGRIAQEIRVDASGLLVSVKLQAAKDIQRYPVECVPAIFPSEF
ncbi:MAG: hypothetical protein FJ279_15875, partial [Planctomycetes bacterium]|nr:hypothetical protein [Planctomycetota bacterium]